MLSPHARARVLSLVRRGPRTVLWTDPTINYGNYLYHWMRAWTEQQKGNDVVALRTASMRPWLPHFPGLDDELLIDRDEVRLTDRRLTGELQGWMVHYWPIHVEHFVAAMIERTTLPIHPRPQDDAERGRVVINIRRGDYFSPEFAPRYSFDQQAYLRLALDRSRLLGGPITHLHLVSDDIDWCRRKLTWLPQHPACGNAQVSFADVSTPQEDFVALATARRLILTHTSFGYWGAHFSNGLYGDNHEDVVVPWFHDRTMVGGAPYHLNPAWTVVRHLPDGWGPEPVEEA